MNIYHVWCDLAPGIRDTEFRTRLATYMDHLRERDLITAWRLIPTARDTDSPPDSAGRESTIRCSPT